MVEDVAVVQGALDGMRERQEVHVHQLHYTEDVSQQLFKGGLESPMVYSCGNEALRGYVTSLRKHRDS